MATRRNEYFAARTGPKTRRTRELVELAQERFSGCDVCRHDDSYNLIDDVLKPLSLRKRERTRLFRALSCPGCESRVESGRWVLGLDRSELRRLSLSKKFDRLHKEELMQFRDFLVKHPMLGAEHPFGRMLSKAVSRAKKTRFEPKPWFRATTNTSETVLGPRSRERASRAYRFNQIGQVAWYLGMDAQTAAVEVLREPKSKVPLAIQRIEILEAVPVLDLRVPLLGGNPTESWILSEVIARRFVSSRPMTVTSLDLNTACRSSSLTSLECMDSGEFFMTAPAHQRTTIPRRGVQISCCLTQSHNMNLHQSKLWSSGSRTTRYSPRDVGPFAPSPQRSLPTNRFLLWKRAVTIEGSGGYIFF